MGGLYLDLLNFTRKEVAMPYINGNKTTRDLEYVTYKGKCALPISNFFEVISVKQSLQNAGDIYVLRGYQSKLLPPVTFELNSIDVTDERRIITALSN